MNKRKLKKKKIEIKTIIEESSDIKFCTECGEVLEDFSVSDQAKNPDAVIENFHNCKRIGRFKGDICSKMYIISPPSQESD